MLMLGVRCNIFTRGESAAAVTYCTWKKKRADSHKTRISRSQLLKRQ